MFLFLSPLIERRLEKIFAVGTNTSRRAFSSRRSANACDQHMANMIGENPRRRRGNVKARRAVS